MEQPKKISELFRPIIKLVVGIAALLLIRILVAVAIPNFEDGAPVILTFIKPFVNLVVNTMMLLLLLNFGKEGRDVLNRITEDKYWGDIIFLTVAIITTGLAHFVYKSVFSIFMAKFIYIYSLIFLIGAAILIVMLGVKIYKNLDRITDVSLEKIKEIPDFLKKLEKRYKNEI